MTTPQERPHFADLGVWLEQVLEGVDGQPETAPWTLRMGFTLASQVASVMGDESPPGYVRLPPEITTERSGRTVALEFRAGLLDGQWELLGNEGVVLYGAIQGYVWDEAL